MVRSRAETQARNGRDRQCPDLRGGVRRDIDLQDRIGTTRRGAYWSSAAWSALQVRISVDVQAFPGQASYGMDGRCKVRPVTAWI